MANDGGSGEQFGAPRTTRQHYVSDTIDWSGVHRTTRTRPTVTSFGWRGKLLLSSPPLAVLVFWGSTGAFNVGVIAVGIGLPMLWAATWWWKQVWAAGRDGCELQVRPRTLIAETIPSLDACRDAAHPSLSFLYDDPLQETGSPRSRV